MVHWQIIIPVLVNAFNAQLVVVIAQEMSTRNVKLVMIPIIYKQDKDVYCNVHKANIN